MGDIHVTNVFVKLFPMLGHMTMKKYKTKFSEEELAAALHSNNAEAVAT